MRTRWFGRPWPSDELRAPICEDDADRVELPDGIVCARCEHAITSDDSGVVMGCSEGMSHAFTLAATGTLVCAEHLECFLHAILGLRAATDHA
jgi:hypothetical protein